MRSPVLPLTAFALALGLAGCGQPSQDKSAPPAPIDAAATAGTPVRTVVARQETVTDAVTVTGSVAATNSVDLAPKLSARVTYVAGREGTVVRKGEVIFRQDAVDQISQVRTAEASVQQAIAGVRQSEANVKSAEAKLTQSLTQARLQNTISQSGVEDAEQQLRSAQLQLEIAKRPQRTQEVNVAESAVAQAQANYDKAVLDSGRYKQLVADGAAAQAQLDQYLTQERVARAALDSAKSQLDLAKTGGREESIRQAETAVRRAEWGVRLAKSNTQQLRLRDDDIKAARAAVAQAQASVSSSRATLASAQANLAQAKVLVDNATLVSPIDGVIARRNAEVGQLIGPTASAVTVVALGTVFFEAQVPETDLGRLQGNLPVQVTVDAYPNRAFAGRVARIYPTGSTASRAFVVRIEIDNGRGELRPGMFARGAVVAARRPGIVIVKDAIVETEDGKNAVFVAADGKAQRRIVTLGVTSALTCEILTGIRAGDAVIVTGQEGLKDGDPVRVATEPSRRTAQAN